MLELIKVNPSSGEPIYRQLHEQIVRLIVGGQLQVDQVLPSVRQLAEHLAVNPMTVSRAIQQLVEQGWLERRRGQPTRVANKQDAPTTTSLQLLESQANDLITKAKQLGICLDDLKSLMEQQWDK
ncbi:GntR family transcriptional regulator [Shewanella sp. 1_MG-2023]|jgi:GntR family transcriptional regulator|uniref:GntR family transcriptional regulator n=1 Tax=Shewanella electrodiphila TaxID=934143 RepID=A0ABT0KTV7_9GAMM|nr:MULTISPECIES: GntR family transcriptional regulator [Shewanella]MCC4833246.1 GntR family transcriptional regulator [Shewanella sp. 10N.7]MCL1047198.1 GntR family transcriptional regulator [Shewanella electrodiphila]MDO6612741.1 GntR family transcriptional regulator [Shewanella sp. 7_MG-2023]MDO6640646.1 GntR family transcriptional regulator [Shewanella sp. 5_MG-2023]MDO6772702.1 GntR family transcriptional regulator [Shewanella sp. 2_MG-2023]